MSAEGICNPVRRTGFTQISNTLIENPKLSTDARWLALYLLSKPSGVAELADIRSSSGWGRDKTYKVLDELRLSSILVSNETRRDENGRFLEQPLEVRSKYGWPVLP
jgi:hypothetical protein